ncbi:hypothetical protein GCM10009802_59710 [Streptomyces synnematoformans]|uniref:Uncharacterized protein n=1 Tax=Streptomyces synnematoformans TaxID=415721 RepID=A0ABN1ZRK4_9ACTN
MHGAGRSPRGGSAEEAHHGAEPTTAQTAPGAAREPARPGRPSRGAERIPPYSARRRAASVLGRWLGAGGVVPVTSLATPGNPSQANGAETGSWNGNPPTHQRKQD